jgi:hypothetical protein
MVYTGAEIALDDMPYAKGVRYDATKGCLPGTRNEVIEEITEWVNSDVNDVPRVFLLSGPAGFGKSAIANSLAQLFDGIGRLGSSYCFDSANQTERRPETLFSTIARDLADWNSEWRSSLCQVINEKPAVRNTRVPYEQFEKFILRPATCLTSVGPLLIVIDALDESGDRESRQAVLAILANKAADLPSNFRILVTARPEQDILDALNNKPHVITKQLDAVDATSTSHDISLFVQTILGDIPGLERKWPNGDWCRLLVERSEGVFIWASTACRFIRGDGTRGLDPVEQMDILLSESRSTHVSHLDQLYSEILNRNFKTENAMLVRRFKSVMGMVLVAREPLSISLLKKFYLEEGAIDAMESIIRPLESLLSGVADDSSPVRLLHVSFRDFLTDQSRSGIFHVNISIHGSHLTHSCFRIMKKELRFNICGMSTSYMRNDELRTHHALNEDAITAQLSYASRFGTDHLVDTEFDEITDEIRDFLQSRLLFWLEVMSLMDGINIALKGLQSIVEWSKVR